MYESIYAELMYESIHTNMMQRWEHSLQKANFA